MVSNLYLNIGFNADQGRVKGMRNPPPPHVRWHAAFWYNYSSKIKLCSLLVLKQNSGAPLLQKNPGSAPVIPLNLLFFLLFLIWVPIFWLTLAQIFIQKGVLGIYYHRNRSQFNGSRGIHYSRSSPHVSNNKVPSWFNVEVHFCINLPIL